eukprot:scaffold319258_cov26-Prasinocladus_malaysianus.AAC.2
MSLTPEKFRPLLPLGLAVAAGCGMVLYTGTRAFFTSGEVRYIKSERGLKMSEEYDTEREQARLSKHGLNPNGSNFLLNIGKSWGSVEIFPNLNASMSKPR